MTTPTLPELRKQRAEQVKRLTGIHAGFAEIKNAMKNGAIGSIKHSAIFHRKAELQKELNLCTREISRLNAEIQNIGDKAFAASSKVTVAKLVSDCVTDDVTAESIFAWFRGNQCSIVARETE